MPWRIGCGAVMGAQAGVVLDSAASLSPFVTQLHRQAFPERTHACESVIAGLALGTGVTRPFENAPLVNHSQNLIK